ncbi:MAG: FliI/YscN family ATPase [Vampirovibrionales bacterium]|nr:FliI/YscN family ATPase [Vampirovibrionales bacterium]
MAHVLDLEPPDETALDPLVTSALDRVVPNRSVGRVDQVVGLIIQARGLNARLGDLCEIHTHNPYEPILPAEVVGFRENSLLLMPLGDMAHLAPGCRVVNTGSKFQVSVGPELKGRILDGLGRPIDDRFEISKNKAYRIESRPPHPLKRREIKEPLYMGVRSIDAFTPIGKGQRVGIFAGSGVGKSTTLGMIARNTTADINVIALIGERGREVQEFIDHSLGPEGLKKSVVIVATSDQPALIKIKAALVATSIAEYFREAGHDVLLMMDSVTRVAMALREIGLAVGEPPTTKGYTPSVFAFMPRLLERAGTGENGSITGLYTVLVEGDDFNEPVADMTRGLLDGHILLTRDLAEQNHFPAVDVLRSVSRLFNAVTTPEHRQMVSFLKDAMATYRKNEDLINIGAYVQGTNPKVDMAIRIQDALNGFLRQQVDEPLTADAMQQHLQGLMNYAF